MDGVGAAGRPEGALPKRPRGAYHVVRGEAQADRVRVAAPGLAVESAGVEQDGLAGQRQPGQSIGRQ